MPRSVVIYVTFLGGAALALLLGAGHGIAQHDWPYLVVLALFTVFFRLQQLKVRRITVSFVSAVNMLSILIAGTPVAVWVAALGNAAEMLIKGRGPLQIVYNISQSVVTVSAAGWVFHLLGGQSGSAFDQIVAALAGSVTYTAVNSVLISVLFAQLHQERALATWSRVMKGEETLYFAIGQVVAVLAAGVAISHPVTGLALFFGVLVLIQHALKAYARMYQDAHGRQRELEAVLNATQSAILVRDRQGVVRHANRALLDMAGIAGGPEQVVGRPHRDLAADPGLAPLFGAVAEAGPPDAQSLRAVVSADLGPIHHLDYYRGPVIGEGAEDGPAGTIEVFTDVTPVKAAEEQLRAVHMSMLKALTAAIDARDPYTHGHSTRVAEYSVLLARDLGLDEADIQRIHYSGLLHDIGKLGVDDRVLRKHGPLTPEERAAMMEHPVIGAQLLEKAGVFLDLLPGVKYHHEWYNGGGYPAGLKGADIPFDARIIGVADAFDAMTSDRPYRPALSPQEALNRLHSGRNIQFDSTVVDAFTRLFQAGQIGVEPRSLSPAGSPAAGGAAAAGREAEAGIIRPVHRRELTILYRVARENYALMDLKAMLRRILEICHDAVAGHFYMILLVEPASGDLVLQATMGHAVDLGTLRLRRGVGIAGQVAESGRPMLVSHIDPAAEPMTVLPASRSSCAVPLKYGGEVIGVLAAESHLPAGCTLDELYLFEAMAQQVASAVELARLQERLAAGSPSGLAGF